MKTENFASLTGEKDPLITSKDIVPVPQLYEYPPAENSQSNAEERADKEVFRKSFLQLRKSCDRLSRKNQSYHGGRRNRYCRHDQNPFQATDLHPGAFDLFCRLARLLHSGREITSQITNEISACENNGHVDHSRLKNSVSGRCRPAELGFQSLPARPNKEPRPARQWCRTCSP